MSVRMFLNICLGMMIGMFVVTSLSWNRQVGDAHRDGLHVNLARRQETLLQNMVDQARALSTTEGEGRKQQLCREFGKTVWLFDATQAALENGGTTTDDSGKKIGLRPVNDPRVLKSVHSSYEIWAGIAPSLLAIADGGTRLDSPSGLASLTMLSECRIPLAETLARTSHRFVQVRNSSRSAGPIIQLLATILFAIIGGVGLLYVNGERIKPLVSWVESLRQGVSDPTSRQLIAENHSEIQELRKSIGEVVIALGSIGEQLNTGVAVASATAPPETKNLTPDPAPGPLTTTIIDSDSDTIGEALDEALADEAPAAEESEVEEEVFKSGPGLTADGDAWGTEAEANPEPVSEPETEKKTEETADSIGDAFDKAVEADEPEEQPAEPEEDEPAAPKNLFILKKSNTSDTEDKPEASSETAPSTETEVETETKDTVDAPTEEKKSADEKSVPPKNLFVLKKPAGHKKEEPEPETETEPEAKTEPEKEAEPEKETEPEENAEPETTAEPETKKNAAENKPVPPKNLFVLKKPTAKKKEEPAVETKVEATPEPAPASPDVSEAVSLTEDEETDALSNAMKSSIKDDNSNNETEKPKEDVEKPAGTPKTLFVLKK